MTSVKRDIIMALKEFQKQALNYQMSLLMGSFGELYEDQFGKTALLMCVGSEMGCRGGGEGEEGA